MPDIIGTSRAQTLFLRAFTNSPTGPDQWPSPGILRRWLRRPGFCLALERILQAIRVQTELSLATAGAAAATSMRHTISDADISTDTYHRQMHSLTQFLRLSHARQRFQPNPIPRPEPTHANLLPILRACGPNVRVYDALMKIDQRLGEAALPDRPGAKLWSRAGLEPPPPTPDGVNSLIVDTFTKAVAEAGAEMTEDEFQDFIHGEPDEDEEDDFVEDDFSPNGVPTELPRHLWTESARQEFPPRRNE